MSKHGFFADMLIGSVEKTLAPIVAVVEGVTGEVSKEAMDGTFRAVRGEAFEMIETALTDKIK